MGKSSSAQKYAKVVVMNGPHFALSCCECVNNTGCSFFGGVYAVYNSSGALA